MGPRSAERDVTPGHIHQPAIRVGQPGIVDVASCHFDTTRRPPLSQALSQGPCSKSVVILGWLIDVASTCFLCLAWGPPVAVVSEAPEAPAASHQACSAALLLGHATLS